MPMRQFTKAVDAYCITNG